MFRRTHLTALLTLALAVVPASASAGTGGAPVLRAPDGLVAAHPPRHGGPPLARAAQRPALSTPAGAVAADPRMADQWPLSADGPLGAHTAWQQTTGGETIVAVIDSGIDLQHADLAPNLWTNPGEVPGNGVDDDGNGVVDDVHGADIVTGDGDPDDENGHGTHVAGIVAARGGNGVGGSGVAWRARLMAVRVLDAQAAGTTATVASGIRYAVANGARILNLSLAGPSSSPDLEAAVREAQAAGALIVTAAGNDASDLATTPTYPAALPEDNVLAVAATAQGGALAPISDFGAGVDLAAPGQDVLSTSADGGYEWRTGTSMAAPHVAGALVLLASARPDLDWRGLRDLVLAGTRRVGLPVATGSLDLAGSLRRALPGAAWRVTPAATTAKDTRAAKAAAKAAARAAAKARKAAVAKARKAAKARRAAARRAARDARIRAPARAVRYASADRRRA